MRDKKANIFKVPYLHGTHGSRCGRHKWEGERALPGEVCRSALRSYRRQEAMGGNGRSQQTA